MTLATSPAHALPRTARCGATPRQTLATASLHPGRLRSIVRPATRGACSSPSGTHLPLLSTRHRAQGHTAAAHSTARPTRGGLSTQTAVPQAVMAPQPPIAATAGAPTSSNSAATKLFAGAMPKEEIGALRFLSNHPEYDGRGVVIAIFDTGVDPGAAGLQVTSDGKPKILDVIDCTGSGDIDTSKVVKADEQGLIPGASGRPLRVNPDWVNPSGEWRVGCRPLLQLLPRPLQSRVKEERKKQFEEAQRAAVAAAATASTSTSSTTTDGATGGSGDSKAAPNRAELEARLTYLKELWKGFEDPGPVVDAVVWHDGSTWRAALDTSDLYALDPLLPAADAADKAAAPSSKGKEEGSDKGLLADHPPMASFAAERQYRAFSELDSCNYAFQMYDNGKVLSVVVDAGSHGTHVAGIAAAHFPDDPAANGVAPGAQIISCKIGDSRLGSMETGTGLTRALIAVLQHKADVINMSYGEPTAAPNKGRVIQLATEVVQKHGVVFVASAGNAGPALTTVGAPGGTSTALLGIGAYVSPALAAAGHSLRLDLPEGQQYTWSSRGPTQDGDIGVAFSAPGGAIAPVPQWTQQRKQLMNGTSMASPNACGGVALLLSGGKALAAAQGLDVERVVTPARIRAAIESTCKPLGGESPDAVLTYGRGLMQVDAAFDHLVRIWGLERPDVRYSISVTASGGSSVPGAGEARGIYLREPQETSAATSFSIMVSPNLHEAAPMEDKLSIEDTLVLSTTASWVSAPALLLLHHNGRSFEARVDPSALPPGLHYAEIHATDASATWRGPVVRIPVTVIKPQQLPEEPDLSSAGGALPPLQMSADAGPAAASAGQQADAAGAGSGEGLLPPHTLRLGPLALSAGQEQRHFIAVPPGATWGELVIRAGAYDTPKTFLIRATQLLPNVRYTDSEYRTTLTLSPNSEYTTSFKVVGGGTLEVTLSQFWSSLGSSSLQLELSFHGLLLLGPSGEEAGGGDGLTLEGAAGPTKVLVVSPLRRQKLKPEAKLTQLQYNLRPADASLTPEPDSRDVLPGGRVVYRLILTYNFTVTEAGKYTPTVPLTNRYLYDSPLEAQLTQVFDAHKRLLYTGDAYPEEVSLSKGEHTIRLLLRHDSLDYLDKLKTTCCVVTRKLDTPLSLAVHSSYAAAVGAPSAPGGGGGGGGNGVGEMFLGAGARAALWVGLPADDKLPKDAAAGAVLTGSMTLGQLRRGSGASPAKYQVTYLVPPAAKAAPKDGTKEGGASSDADKDKSPETKLEEALRDAKLKMLKSWRPTKQPAPPTAAGAAAAEPAAAPAAAGDGSSDKEREALAQALIAELKAAWPKHLPLLLECLRRLDGKDIRSSQLPAIVAAADDVLAAIDTTALAAFLALRAPAEEDDSDASAATAGAPAAASSAAGGAAGKELAAAGAAAPSPAASYKAQKVVMDEAKAALLEALTRKLAAQLDLAEAGGQDAAAAAAGVKDTAAALRRWVDTSAEDGYLLLHARVEARAGRFAAALKALDKWLGSEEAAKPGSSMLVNKEGGGCSGSAAEVAAWRAELLGRCGWAHWQMHALGWNRVKYPGGYPLM